MSKSPIPAILGVGGAHIDRRGHVTGDYVAAASNPGVMREEVGGGAFNALRIAQLRGASVSLLSLRGGDAAAEAVSRAISEAGMEDYSAVFLDRASPSYLALLDRHGDLIVGFADMTLYDLAFTKQLRRSKAREIVAMADAVICDANLPATALEKLAALVGGKPFFAIGISPAKAQRLRGIFGALTLAFLNHNEAKALTGLGNDAPPRELVAALRTLGLKGAVMTSGPNPAIGFDAKGAFTIAPPAPDRVSDVTGAGDALAGATMTALLAGVEFRQAVRHGVAAAKLAVESPHVFPGFTAESFAAALALVPEPEEVA